jgi:hypothetical protein
LPRARLRQWSSYLWLPIWLGSEACPRHTQQQQINPSYGRKPYTQQDEIP